MRGFSPFAVSESAPDAVTLILSRAELHRLILWQAALEHFAPQQRGDIALRDRLAEVESRPDI